jgi:TetR/AcrR family transcriptional regulator, transcriptional repressor for nem operon
MARPREFDREDVLDEAIKVFSDHGFGGTSTDVLLEAMGISRQSMYDTFGDKRRLYLEALQRYSAGSVSKIIRSLNTARSPLKGLEAAMVDFASRPAAEAGLGCLGVSSTCEFGLSDREIAVANDASARTLRAALERAIADGKASGEIRSDVDVRTAAQFIGVTFSGMKVAARGGLSAGALRDIARIAIRSLG